MTRLAENAPAILFLIGSLCFVAGNAILIWRGLR